MTPRLSVVVVDFNSSVQTVSTLREVSAQLQGIAWDGAVVDNASTDLSRAVLGGVPPRVRVVHNACNVGFGRAVNQGVQQTEAPFILLLNPDSLPMAGAIERLCNEMDRWADCAAAGPHVLNPDGTSQGSARWDPNLLTGLFGRSTILSRAFPRLYWVRKNIVTPADVPAGETSRPVDWVSGAFVLLRRSAFEQVGGFDEGYFLYWEDADLGRRLRNAGYSVRYVPDAKVEHQIGGSSHTVPHLAIREFHRSAYRYYTTHVARRSWHPARLLATIVLTLRCRYYLKKAGPESTAARPRAADLA